MIVAYTDGSSRGNPGPAGWAVLIDGELHSDWLPYATNNEAELYAVLMAVMLCPSYAELKIVTDSKMVIGWLSKSWRIRQKHIASLVKAYWVVRNTKGIAVTFEHVKGHEGHPGNEAADRAARARSKIAQAVLNAKRAR